jgi:hypothetical protein
MKSRRLRSTTLLSKLASASVRVGLLGVAAIACGSCNSFDSTRVPEPEGTLGDDIYGLFCDRVGASSLPEDLSGASFHDVCHFDASGRYGQTVDLTVLPPPSSSQAKAARQLSIAKMNAMVAHRDELVQAFNSAFPNPRIADPNNPGKTLALHDALFDLLQKITPLYTSNPYLPSSDPLLPASTRALGRLFDALGGHAAPSSGADAAQPALNALASMAAREGYRPFNVALGAIRPGLAYPNLRTLTKASLAVLGPTGTASPVLQQLLSVSKQTLLASRPLISKLPPLRVDASTSQPNRPRTDVEVAEAILLDQDDAYAQAPSDPSRFIARRDARGFVVPIGNQPGVAGTVQSPFVDQNNDGYADVDTLGRFLGGSGQPVTIAPPFDIPGVVQMGNVDAYGRPIDSKYQYIDTSRTTLAAVARHLVPLLDSTKEASGPDAWQQEHETIMYAMAGAFDLYGRRTPLQYDFAADAAGAADAIKPAGESCPGCFAYTGFNGDESPLVDMAHAAGQVLADPDSDALLLGVMDLVQNHEQDVARLLGALLKIRDISAQHDALAAQGAEPAASLDYTIPIWDQMAQVLQRIVERPGLTQKLLGALADSSVVSQQETSANEGDTLAAFAKYRDFMTYDPNDINGPPLNTTVGGTSTAPPQSLVNRHQPLNGNNRSLLQRSFQVIHDAHGARLCNKPDAYIEGQTTIPIIGTINLEWPAFGAAGYDECELFQIDDAAAFYLDTILPAGHAKKSVMPLNSSTVLGEFLGFAQDAGYGGTVDDLLATSAGIDGLTTQPSPQAINRLLFFGADTQFYSNMPDHDSFNDGSNAPTNTNNFVSNLVNAASPNVCTVDGSGVPRCPDDTNTYRVRDFGSMFAWEHLGYYNYLLPMVKVFAEESCNNVQTSCSGSGCCWSGGTVDLTGEEIFIDLFETLWQHWPGQDHGTECNEQGSLASNPMYCSGAGVNKYEPILADSFSSDLIPALNEFASVVTTMASIQVQRGPHAGETWSAAEVLEKMTKILFDQGYAQSVHMVDRHGGHTATWVDGTPQAQLTPFTLFADALHKMDTTFDQGACSCAGLTGQAASTCQSHATACQADATTREGMWKRARSQLVDEFFTIDGTGSSARFDNPATPKALVTIVQVLREQLNANCPTRETGGGCAWAKTELAQKLQDTISGPLFAGVMDVQESVRANDDARRELENFLSFILLTASQGDAYQSSLAGFGDFLQILSDDGRFAPIFNAAATASDPESDKAGPGCADTAINVLEALSGDDYDTYHVLDTVLPALVTPVGGARSPIEVVMDTIADVNRVDASQSTPLDANDYRAVWTTMNQFMSNDTRGLEQLYTIMQSRPTE